MTLRQWLGAKGVDRDIADAAERFADHPQQVYADPHEAAKLIQTLAWFITDNL